MVRNPRGSNTTYARTAWRATPCGRVLFTLVWASGPVFPPRETLGPRVYSFLPLNNQNQITMDPSCTELAPLSALGHSNTKMQVSGFARTSPFICFGAHQYPNSNNDGPQLDRTNPIICFGAQQHQNASIGWGNKQWGKHSVRPAIVVFLQRGAGAKKKIAIFLRNPFLRRAQSQKLIFCCVFFCGKTTRWTGN